MINVIAFRSYEGWQTLWPLHLQYQSVPSNYYDTAAVSKQYLCLQPDTVYAVQISTCKYWGIDAVL